MTDLVEILREYNNRVNAAIAVDLRAISDESPASTVETTTRSSRNDRWPWERLPPEWENPEDTMDLYKHSLTGAKWTRPCGGNQDAEEMDSCVEVAEIPGGYAVRDSKNPGAGVLRFTADEMDGFVRGWPLT